MDDTTLAHLRLDLDNAHYHLNSEFTREEERNYWAEHAAYLSDELAYALGEKCPRCDSPRPELHPAVQYEGEVEGCIHEFHGDYRQRPGESLRDMSQRLYRKVRSSHD